MILFDSMRGSFVMSHNDTTTGRALIQEQVATMLVEPLEADSVVLAAGPRIFNSSEPLRIPTLTAGFNPTWVGEGELIPDGEKAAFGEIRLMPTERKSIKTITRVTNELIRQATAGIAPQLQSRLVRDVAAKLDDGLLNGDGAADTVTGLLNQPGTQKATLDLADTDSLLEALALAAAAEVTPNRWLLNGGDFFTLRKLKDGNGRHLLQNEIAGEAKLALFGVPVTVSNKIPAGKAILADMSKVAVVRDIDPTVTVLTERYAEYDEVGIRVTTRYDLGLIHPEAVLVLSTAGAA